MADEQTPQSDLIDDAIRQAERQLEEKLQALRLSALGETTPAATGPDDDVAVLRPTGASLSRASEPAAPPAHEADASAPEDGEPQLPAPVAWQETGGDDVTFAPVGTTPGPLSTGLYVPDEERPLDDAFGELGPEATSPAAVAPTGDDATSDHDDAPDTPTAVDEPAASSMRDSLSATVTDLTPVWDDEDEASAAPLPPQPSTRRSSQPEDRPEPVHATWTDPTRSARREPTAPARTTSLPSEDELQFWAQTRTALRNLQQVTDGLSTQVVGGVSGEVARMLHEQLAPTDQAVRAVHDRLESDLPRLGDRIEQALQQAIVAPSNAIRQVRDEIPSQLERSARASHEAVRDELERAAASVHGAVQHDISQLEQSIATNVTRMAQGTTDQVGRVERDVDVLGETVVRFERGVHAEFDRIETQLRTSIERVEHDLRDELVEPTELVRKLDQELPARFTRVERSLNEQLQSSQRDMANVLTSLVDADRAALDRLASLASTMDEDRARRAEDLDVVVDTVTTGWEGLAGAVAALFEQAEQQSRRLAGIEHRLLQLRDVEGALQTTLDEFQRHVRDLKPSPIVVTVSHDDAEVRNATRGGWVESTER